jgi:hypothetical protein
MFFFGIDAAKAIFLFHTIDYICAFFSLLLSRSNNLKIPIKRPDTKCHPILISCFSSSFFLSPIRTFPDFDSGYNSNLHQYFQVFKSWREPQIWSIFKCNHLIQFWNLELFGSRFWILDFLDFLIFGFEQESGFWLVLKKIHKSIFFVITMIFSCNFVLLKKMISFFFFHFCWIDFFLV